MFDKIKAMVARRTPDQNEVHRRLRQLMVGLSLRGAASETAKDVRRVALMLAKAAATPKRLRESLKGMGETEDFHHTETLSWLTPAQIEAGESGPFEACNLLSWLVIAEKAGVAAVPATVILRLTDAETEAAAGELKMPTGPIPDRIRKQVQDTIAADGELATEMAEAAAQEPSLGVDWEALVEKLFAAMDDVPANVMVRTTQCGASTLKSLAGTGMIDAEAPEVRFGNDLEVGPGWVRVGNRRRVDSQDMRLIKGYVEGPHTGMTFVARPWITASRHIEGRDPHRAGTPFDAPGHWPAEWRAFVKDGKACGVSSYYAWVDSATPETARTAIKIRALAQKMVDAALAQGLEPRYASVEHARRNPELAAMLEDKGFGPGTFSATIDFIETEDGPIMLEAGPGMSPVGGAHPCAFAGVSGPPRYGNPTETVGVAFRHMDHVVIAEPSTWIDGDRTDRILDWDAVEALAAS